MHVTELSGPVNWEDSVRWDGVGGGRRGSGWRTHVHPYTNDEKT